MACPIKVFILFAVNCFVALWGLVDCNKTAHDAGVDIFPHDSFPYLVHEEESKHLTFDIQNGHENSVNLQVVTSDQHIADVENRTYHISKGSTNFTVKIMGKFLGRTLLKFSVSENKSVEKDYDVVNDKKSLENQFDWFELPDKYEIAVGRVEGALSHSFTGLVIILVCLANVAMGCKTELSVVKEVLKKPIAPLTGMFSQFVLMPMVSRSSYFFFFSFFLSLIWFQYLYDSEIQISYCFKFCAGKCHK